MRTLVVHDNEGYVFSIQSSESDLRLPVGIPYIYTEIPFGMQIKIVEGIGVDTSLDVPILFLEEIPKTDFQRLEEMIEEHGAAMIEIVEMIVGGE